MANKEVVLDVRDMLREKQEPFQVIMEKVDSLKEDEDLVLVATFEPVPLLKVMKNKGFDNTVEQLEPEHFVVRFFRA